jgi:hypothetical protein
MFVHLNTANNDDNTSVGISESVVNTHTAIIADNHTRNILFTILYADTTTTLCKFAGHTCPHNNSSSIMAQPYTRQCSPGF